MRSSDIPEECFEDGTTEFGTVYFALFGPVGSAELLKTTLNLSRHPEPEIAERARKIYRSLTNIINYENY